MNLTSNRFFGIEIECKNVSMEAARDALNNAGIPCRIEHYGHSTPTSWKIVPDSSVSDGFEIVSPKLSGNGGLEQVRKVSAALNEIGARVARDCGFHVHVDATDLSACTLHNVLKRYAAYENVIDTFMPRSRRGNENRYCRNTSELLGFLHAPTGRSSVREYLSAIDSDRRYYKVNVAAFLRHGTVEFRHHSGTTMANKMIPWIIFCVNFVETSRVTINVVNQTPQPVAQVESPTVSGTRSNSLARKFQALARVLYGSSRYTYVAPERIAAALDCSVESVPNYISRFRAAHPRFEIKVRRGRGYYLDIFYASDRGDFLTCFGPMGEGTSAPTVTYDLVYQEDTGVFHGLDNEIVSYFQERIVELAQ